MGCDIHAYAEVKVNGHWRPLGKAVYDHVKKPDGTQDIAITELDIGRYYTLFGLLAGVRSGGEPLIPRRGVPQDSREDILREHKQWGVDAHSASHWYLNEVLEHRETFEREGCGEFLDITDTLVRLVERHHIKLNDARIVFWFDN